MISTGNQKQNQIFYEKNATTDTYENSYSLEVALLGAFF